MIYSNIKVVKILGEPVQKNMQFEKQNYTGRGKNEDFAIVAGIFRKNF